MSKHIFVIDTSALLSGKAIHIENAELISTPALEEEIQPGGRDYRMFQYLREKGLTLRQPTSSSVATIKKTAKDTGDDQRLSSIDIGILALALEMKQTGVQTTLLTDDYSMQNIASILDINYQGISQKGIRRQYKWKSYCPGCHKTLEQSMDHCPICGSKTKQYRVKI